MTSDDGPTMMKDKNPRPLESLLLPLKPESLQLVPTEAIISGIADC